MSWNPFKAIDRVVDKGSNVLHNARDEFKDTTRAVRRTASSAANTVRREVGETSQALRRTSNNFANTARREFNETTQAAKRTTNRAVNTVRREVGETSQALRRTSNNFANTARREFNETTQAAKRTTNRAVNTVRQANWRDVGHTVLDGAGFIPVVGAAADVANGAWYAAEGNWTDAGFALGAAVPFAGDAFAAGKLANKGVKLVKDAKGTRTFITYTLRDGDGAVRYVGRASGKGSPEAVLDRRINGWRGHHILRKHPELDPRNARLDAVQGNKAANQGAEDVLYSRYQIHQSKLEPGEKLTVNGRELALGANTNQGARPLLNRTNPQSNEPRKIRNPFLNEGRYSTPRPDGKMSVFEKIEAYARDLKQP